MSAALKPVVEYFSFDGEAVGLSFDGAAVGAAGAAALRRVKSLAEAAPQGRLFAAISTLSDNAGLAASEYEAASLAMLRGETAEASAHIARGSHVVHRLTEAASGSEAVQLPDFMRRR